MVRPALASGNARLLARTKVTRLVTDDSGRRVVAADAVRDGQPMRIEGGTFVVSCGAVRSAALLLASANGHHPNGLANSSGQVGRNYMAHNLTELIAVGSRVTRTTFQKTLGINDFYLTSPIDGRPLGNVQMMGKVHPEMSGRLPALSLALRRALTRRSLELVVVSEDLPNARNRVELTPDGQVRLSWTPNNLAAHHELVARATRMLRRSGYPLVFARPQRTSTSHQCGTVRFGADPTRAVLDPRCRAFDLDNLLVVDASFMPSSAALNPGLTIAAQALRVADLAVFDKRATAH
jgi:choline dehydrogenase-like flavoprotein